jgi:protein-L-isoaspartate O-methyltransferase
VNPDDDKEKRMTMTAPAASPEHLNQVMIDAIAAARPVSTSDPRVLDAIRAVPRHAFVPGASLADAYNPDLAVITKRDTGGKSLSRASVPCLVGAMLEQLDVRDGHRVFEAGAGTGWNTALLTTLAGPGGHVTTIDIDPEVSAQAAANLERAGFPGVRVATGDAGLGVPENAPELPLALTDDQQGQRSGLFDHWHQAMHSTASALLANARQSMEVRTDLDVSDLLALTHGAALTGADAEQIERLLTLIRSGAEPR